MTVPKRKSPQKEMGEVQGRDLFQTPNYATELLVPFIPKHIKYIYEPACGGGKIVNVLQNRGFYLIASDLSDGVDFMKTDVLKHIFLKDNTAIITNPPYSLKRKFYDRCRYLDVPFALLIPADYCGWIIEAIKEGAEKIIPTRRIDFITPTGKDGRTTSSNFHSLWLTWGFGLGKSETFVELTQKDKENI